MNDLVKVVQCCSKEGNTQKGSGIEKGTLVSKVSEKVDSTQRDEIS